MSEVEVAGPVAPEASRPGARAATRRRLIGLAVLLGLLVVVTVASLGIGANPISPGHVWSALIHGGDSIEAGIVRDQRVPRTVLGLIVGGALALAGALMQGVTRNPLADPGLLGVSAGSSLAVVLGVGYLSVSPTGPAITWLALAGAAVTSVVVYGLGARGSAASGPARLALAGAAVTAALLSVVRGISLLEPRIFDTLRFWVVGSLGGRPLGVAWQIAPFVAVGVLLAAVLARGLNTLALGDDLARALGARPGLVRAGGALAVVLLSGAATAACGPIVFVGLVVPHAVRAVTGPDQRWILPYSLLAGPVLLLGADIIGRVVAPPSEIGVGICVAVIGAPMFIALVRRRRLAAL